MHLHVILFSTFGDLFSWCNCHLGMFTYGNIIPPIFFSLLCLLKHGIYVYVVYLHNKCHCWWYLKTVCRYLMILLDQYKTRHLYCKTVGWTEWIRYLSDTFCFSFSREIFYMYFFIVEHSYLLYISVLIHCWEGEMCVWFQENGMSLKHKHISLFLCVSHCVPSWLEEWCINQNYVTKGNKLIDRPTDRLTNWLTPSSRVLLKNLIWSLS